MDDNTKNIRLKGFTISKYEFEAKYKIVLTNLEWASLCTRVNNSWEESIQEVKLLAFKHIRSAMSSIGYKPSLDNKDITFVKDFS